MDKRAIYLDYMATTPIDPIVVEAMLQYMGPTGFFGNPSSTTHDYGRQAAQGIEKARAQIAEAVGCEQGELVFTSGATESNNLAILGAAHFYQRKGRHVITMATEHKAVLDSFRQLEREGFEVSYLNPQADGVLDLAVLEAALRSDTILVSIMQVNNETGVIQDIPVIGEFLRGKGIIFHVDAAQSAGKLPINLTALPVDLMSFSAHKNYGPKGVGALFVRQKPRIRLEAQSYGGGQEGGLRAGTLPTHQIVGMGEAFTLAEKMRIQEQQRLAILSEQLWNGICHLPGIQLNGSVTKRIPSILNISFLGFKGETLLTAFSELAISTVSACSSARSPTSHVLQAMGFNQERTQSAIRLSLGRYTTEAEIKRTISIIDHKIQELAG